MPLHQLDNPSEPRFHIGGESIHLISHPGVEQLYEPSHLTL
jgi:hypothetical protein